MFFNNKKKGEIYTNKDIKEFKQYYHDTCNIEVFRNITYPAVSFLPIVLALVMIILYAGGFNERGTPLNIQVSGIVERKSINYDKHGKASGYDLHIVENETNKKYTVPVNRNIYDKYNENDKLLIKAKKGSLGILYDQWIYMRY